MKRIRIGVIALLSLLSVQASGASAELELTKQYERLLGGDAAAAKSKLGCPGAWQEMAGGSPDGKRMFTTHRCVQTEGQVYVTDGKVFAIGLRLHSGLDSRRASALNKEIKQGLTKAGCKLTDRGQAAVARCADGKAIAVLDNWDSRANTNNISMLYGLGEILLPIMGIPAN